MQTTLTFIGKIHTPYKSLDECPRNINFNGPECTIEFDPAYQHDLKGLETEQHIMVLYWLGDTGNIWNNDKPSTSRGGKGTFAMRSPIRPNPIGVAVLPIGKITADRITVNGLDCLDQTKLLDIKPAIYREITN